MSKKNLQRVRKTTIEKKNEKKLEIKYLYTWLYKSVLAKAKQPLIQYYAEAMCKGSILYNIDTYLMTRVSRYIPLLLACQWE